MNKLKIKDRLVKCPIIGMDVFVDVCDDSCKYFESKNDKEVMCRAIIN